MVTSSLALLELSASVLGELLSAFPNPQNSSTLGLVGACFFSYFGSALKCFLDGNLGCVIFCLSISLPSVLFLILLMCFSGLFGPFCSLPYFMFASAGSVIFLFGVLANRIIYTPLE